MPRIIRRSGSTAVTAVTCAAIGVVLAGGLPAEAQTTRVSETPTGAQGDGASIQPAVTAKGPAVVLASSNHGSSIR